MNINKRIGSSIIFILLFIITIYSAVAVDNSFTPIINSSLGYNSTSENITAYGSSIDNNIYQWYYNNSNGMVFDFEFEGNDTNESITDLTTSASLITNYKLLTYNKTGGYNGNGVIIFNPNSTDTARFSYNSEQTDYFGDKDFSISTLFYWDKDAQVGSSVTLWSSSYSFRLSIYSPSTNAIGWYNTNGAWFGGTLTNDAWNYVVFSRDNLTSRFYINGVLVNEDTNSTATPVIYDYAYVGSYGLNQYGFSGKMDFVRGYKQHLTEGQVKSNWKRIQNDLEYSILDSSMTNVNDNISFCVYAYDTLNYSDKKCSDTITILSSLPVVSNVTLYPSVNVTSITSLYGNATYIQEDNTSGYLNFKWYVNNVNVFNESFSSNNNDIKTSSLDPNYYTSNDNVYFVVIPQINNIYGNDVTSNNVTIINSNFTLTRDQPSDYNVSIVEPNTQQFSVNLIDIDNDAIIKWYKNGVYTNETGRYYSFIGSYDSSGTYNITAIASDSEYSQSIEWNLEVENTLVDYELVGIIGLIVLLGTIIILYYFVKDDLDFEPLKIFFFMLIPFILMLIIRYSQTLVEVAGNNIIINLFNKAYYLSMMITLAILIYVVFLITYKIFMFLKNRGNNNNDFERLS